MSPAPRKAAAAQDARAARREVLLDLLHARGPSGYEGDPTARLARGRRRVRRGQQPTSSARRWRSCPREGGKGTRRRLLVMGHIDEIGLIVTHIDDDGFLWFSEVGGWDPQILVGQRVVIDTARARQRPGRQEADPPAAR